MDRHVFDGGKFEFEVGESIENLKVVYHTSPFEYNPEKKVIWLCHALTASSDSEGEWWPALVGPGKLIDTQKYFVICANALGSACGSSGPASINPKTGKPYRLAFPKVTVRDTVRAFDMLRKHLGIEKIDILIGTSMGGFMSFEWAYSCPEIFGKVFIIASGACATPWITGFNTAMRFALEADPTFKAGTTIKGGLFGLKAARAIALLTYRCEEGLFKQEEESEDFMFAEKVSSYYSHQSLKFIKSWDAYSYKSICDQVDSNNLGRGRGGLKAALGMLKGYFTLVCMSSDELFPPEDMKPLAAMIPGARYFEIPTVYGHDGFLIETDAIGKILQPAVEELV